MTAHLLLAAAAGREEAGLLGGTRPHCGHLVSVDIVTIYISPIYIYTLSTIYTISTHYLPVLVAGHLAHLYQDAVEAGRGKTQAKEYV